MDTIKNKLNEKPSSFEELKEAVKNAAGKIAGDFQKAGDEFQNAIKKATSEEEIKKVIAAAKEKFDEASTIVKGDLKQIVEKLKNILEYVNNKKNEVSLDELKEAVKNQINQVGDLSNKIGAKLKNEIEKAKNLDEVTKVLAAAQEFIEKALTTVDGGLKTVRDKMKEIYDSITSKN